MASKQIDRIYRHMSDYGSITALEAVQEYGIMQLAARIADMEKAGLKIHRQAEKSKNRYGESVRFVRYSLGGQEEQANG